MSGVERDRLAWADEPPPLVRWWSWPVRQNLLGSVAMVVGIGCSAMVVHHVTERLHLVLFAVLALAVALWRFFLPVMFELNGDGVNQWVLGRHRRISWNDVRRYEICSGGVLLLPHTDYCPMDSFRGFYLPWAKRRDEVMAQVRYYLDPPDD